ncbi:MAG: hypothetical protein OXE76_04140 [Alphaproteobacteria bacterium]|nr:hypothetical protein [Alphaproteobacteria bacterium]
MSQQYTQRHPVGPYRDARTVAVGGAEDFVLDSGFTCQVETAGDLVYRTLLGTEDQTVRGLAVGDTITGPGGIPVVLRAIRASSTVTSVVIGCN